MKMARKKHRGRFQAQGGGLEASETWNQDTPITKEQAKHLLDKLKEKIPPEERAKRAGQFDDAGRFIDGVKGGVDAPQKRTFLNRKQRGVRVDIEIWSGTAFIAIIILILVVLWMLN